MPAPLPNPKAFSVLSVEGFQDLPAILREVETGSAVALRPPGIQPADVETLGKRSGAPEGEGSLGVWSSGSSGRPKLIWRAWTDLARWSGDRSTAEEGMVWGSCFDPWSFAGALVAVHAYRYGETVIGLGGSWESVWADLREHQVSALSVTATFLRLALLGEPNDGGASWEPRQITLGGEVASEAFLRQVSARFPRSRLTVVYAAAEGGVLAKCHDQSGWFPVSDLEREGRAFEVRDQGLFLRAADGAWWDTGDRIEVEGARFRPLGRLSRVVNVGGAKVALDDVERALETVPGVANAVAWAQANPVVGQVVAVRVEWLSAEDSPEARDGLRAHARANLPKPGWPRLWEFGAVDLGPNGKRALHAGGEPKGLETDADADNL